MSQAVDMDRLILPVGERDHRQGSKEAVVTLVEYGDYQSPNCGRAHVIVQEIQRQLTGQLCFVFRHFPQPQLHTQAQKAAEVAEAAAAQGKFWEMHDILFNHQHALGNGYLVEYVINLGLNVTQVLRELADHIHDERVQEDFESGTRSGVTQTPAFFINGVRHNSNWDRTGLLAAIVASGRLGNF
ncbi:thioredoxin domain-containing protein [Leptolyngbya sp. FACHB-261]|uniref:DsbA family protein n=1 Tax=Leptolyngbya sp. FACHB-261 TaxID=2692806 RepID=UPI00168677E0|nr:thioredoxin domain-containing protein [Leptolyngbya sp. FACHB-261]MBD2103955.1 thioredoxin domain-containing protein [Leptolyngbya sp. FACHB-261]